MNNEYDMKYGTSELTLYQRFKFYHDKIHFASLIWEEIQYFCLNTKSGTKIPMKSPTETPTKTPTESGTKSGTKF